MATARNLTLADVLIALRQRMVDARDAWNLEALAELVTTFDLMSAAAAQYDDPRATEIIVSLDRATRSAIMDSKATGGPTADEIKQALD